MEKIQKKAGFYPIYSDSYPVIPKGQEGGEGWRDALVTGNGWTGLLESFAPQEDVLIYQDTRLVLDTNQIYRVPEYADVLEQIRTNAVRRKDLGIWAEAAAASHQEMYGITDWVSSDVRPFHPAARMRIHRVENVDAHAFRRYTDYRSGEIGSSWKDAKGMEWITQSFASRENKLVVTRMLAPQGECLNARIGMDSIWEMPVEQENLWDYGIPHAPQTLEGAQTGEENWVYQCGKYGSFPVGGIDGNPLCEFHDGGWAAAVLVFTDGSCSVEESIRDIPVNEKFTDGKKKTAADGIHSRELLITGAGKIVLVAGIARAMHGLENMEAVRTRLLSELKQNIWNKAAVYAAQGEFDYEKAFHAHRILHEPSFSAVHLELCSEEESKDRALSNEALMEKQRETGKMNKAYVERLFDNGRFGLLCCSGYHAPRLGGMWTGCFMPLFHGDFISNANLNLQISSANIGHMPEAADGYIRFILRQLPDWEKNARNIYGMKHALKAAVHTSGEGNGQFYHSLPGYPHGYCNAITDWMILPVFEYYQCFGNRKIAAGEDLSVESLRSVCGYEEGDIQRIYAEGFRLLEDVLIPLLRGLMNFWTQYVDERFYMEENGTIHLNDGTTIGECEMQHPDAQPCYLLTPGYSAENAPGGEGYNDLPALAAHTAMDIAALKNSLDMAETIAEETEDFSIEESWLVLKKRIPDYRYTQDGAIKEWALDFLPENDDHRHVSHGYAAWPAHEFRHDRKLKDGIHIAMKHRTMFNKGDDAMAHGHLHKALIAARLKDVREFEEELHTVTTGEYQYTSLMTAHDKGRKSAYCTDLAMSYPGLVLEALVYSNQQELELLPTLPAEWTQGKLDGVMARCRAEIRTLFWNLKVEDAPVVTAVVLPGTDRKVRLSAGVSWNRCRINGEEKKVIVGADGSRFIEWDMKNGQATMIEFLCI